MEEDQELWNTTYPRAYDWKPFAEVYLEAWAEDLEGHTCCRSFNNPRVW